MSLFCLRNSFLIAITFVGRSTCQQAIQCRSQSEHVGGSTSSDGTCRCACSGLLHDGEPITATSMLGALEPKRGRSVSSSALFSVCVHSTVFASPQSTTRVSPCRPSMMFPGLRSRCNTPLPCRVVSASQT